MDGTLLIELRKAKVQIAMLKKIILFAFLFAFVVVLWLSFKPRIEIKHNLPLFIDQVLNNFGEPISKSNKSDLMLRSILGEEFPSIQSLNYFLYKSKLKNYDVQCLFSFQDKNLIGLEISLYPKQDFSDTVENINLNRFVIELVSDLVDLELKEPKNDINYKKKRIPKVTMEKRAYPSGIKTVDNIGKLTRHGFFCGESNKAEEVMVLIY